MRRKIERPTPSNDVTKDNLILEAKRQLAERGPFSVTMRSICSAVGIADSQAYRYFRNRQHLLEVASRPHLSEIV